MRSGRAGVTSATVRTIFGRPPLNEAGWSGTGSFYEEIGVRRLAAVVSLLTLSISLWLFTTAKVRISVIPPDAFFLVNQLPGAYWLGLFSTILLLPARNLVAGRARTCLEIASLFMLSLYIIGLPSFVYQNPRFLDTYQHEVNSMSLLFLGGWFNNTFCYVYQIHAA